MHDLLADLIVRWLFLLPLRKEQVKKPKHEVNPRLTGNKVVLILLDMAVRASGSILR